MGECGKAPQTDDAEASLGRTRSHTVEEQQSAITADAIALTERDNVATALRDLQPGEIAVVSCAPETFTVQIHEPVPYGHKFAVVPIAQKGEVLKYGEVMGRATSHIAPGSHAHVHNIESLRGRGDLENQDDHAV